jgi:hypothetical protein
MGASIIPAATITTPSDNWVQIAATNPAASSLNFTGISGYKKLMVFYGYTGGTYPNLSTVRLNADSGTKYAFATSSNVGSTLASSTSYGSSALATSAAWIHFLMKISSTDNVNTKEFTTTLATTNNKDNIDGIYQASAAISQVNLTWASTFSSTVYLYGVLA